MKQVILSVAAAIGLAGNALAQEPVWDGNTVILESLKIADGVFAVIPTGADDMSAAGYRNMNVPAAYSGLQ